ncbi:MAG: 3'-5' exonuclease domain-containing protein 2 [Bacteroidales bacterium]|nr:3'-5' exonuclease domain-containing protein 2 [Bacteroidales bacterium]MCM1147256.1 3'-5' exonuclease domain-containing protein 2 [Bacteroidales bacterium]MCM1206311.1 3'-5' exonuclease domain-containing protein 2 [Bacillota bacterium]MCM1510488.1 3'-5' exonuclease domain-containing protein 2 [Clostridium sp.]
MKKHITNKFNKKLMPTLPRAVFEGKTVVVLNESEAEKAVDFLLSQKILGLDTETRPSFVKGRQHKVALLQVATHDICFLFRLNILKKSMAVKHFLEDTKVKKIGLSWHDDIRSLGNRIDFKPGSFIELQDEVKSVGIEDQSLAKIFANLFQHRISKREQLSNWEADILSDKQKLYAATDAWACIMIYEELMRLKETGDYELEIIPDDIPHESGEATA